MAEPGTEQLDRHDHTRKQKYEYRSLTSQIGGVTVISRHHRVLHAQATVTQFSNDIPAVAVVTSSDKKSVTVYTSTDEPVTIDLMLMGD